MAQINFRIDDDIKAEAETLFASLGMNTTTALMIFIRQSLTEHAIPFAIRQVPSWRDSVEDLTSRIRDLEAGRNCHVHELLDDSSGGTAKTCPVHGHANRGVRRRHAKALA